MTTCFANIGSADTPIQCPSTAELRFVMSSNLSTTELCEKHSAIAFANSMVREGLIRTEEIK